MALKINDGGSRVEVPSPKDVQLKAFAEVETTKNPFTIARARMQKAVDLVKFYGETISPELETRLMGIDKTAERTFTVEGVDEVHGMRCHHVEIEGLIGKGGNRFEPNLSADRDRTLTINQTPKNLNAGLPYYGTKGGAKIDSEKLPGETDQQRDIRVSKVAQRWVDTFMDMIGPYMDVPAGDWGVNSKEVGWMVERYRDNLMKIAKAAVTGETVELGTYKTTGPDLKENEVKVEFTRETAVEYFKRNVGLNNESAEASSWVLKRISEDKDFAMDFAKPGFTGKFVEMGGHDVRNGATGRAMVNQALEAAKYQYIEGKWRTGEGIKLSPDQEELLDMHVKFHLGEGEAGTRGRWKKVLSESREMMREIEKALFKDATLIVTGAGKVSLGTIDHFNQLDCGVKLLGISDIKGAIINTGEGIDIKELIDTVKSTGSVVNYDGAEVTDQNRILATPCTVLISGTPEFAYMDKDTSQLVQAEMHIEGTNGPNTLTADDTLEGKGTYQMSDIMANAGGVTGSGLEWARNLHAIRSHLNKNLVYHIDGLGLEVQDGRVADSSMYHALDRLMVKDYWTTLATARKYKTDLGTASRINSIFYLKFMTERQEGHRIKTMNEVVEAKIREEGLGDQAKQVLSREKEGTPIDQVKFQ